MAELSPLPLALHLKRVLTELELQGSIYDLPLSKAWRPAPAHDLACQFHGRRAATPFGPAAGPQDQLLQNIVLSFLGGSRIVELKTVQILDQLKIPRPCIYAGNLGYNVEWSQELRLEQSLQEYVGASMMLDILKHLDVLGSGPESYDHILDLSVGYDLKGISSPQVRSFIDRCCRAESVIDELRTQLPKPFRTLDFRSHLVNSITLSTFHGCPKDEIEGICRYLLCEVGVNTVIKLNPTQLQRPYLEGLLYEQMGYSQLQINPKAWATSLSLEEALAIVERLEPLAKERNLNIGVKFSNTLELVNREPYFQDEVCYLSGPPLHVIAICLVEEWRKLAGNRFPITFAAGIDRENFPDAQALGLIPTTACTDLLKTRGYARSTTYLQHLEEKMERLEAGDLEEWILLAYQQHTQATPDWASLDPHPSRALELACQARPQQTQQLQQEWTEWVNQVSLLNTSHYAERVRKNPRYSYAKNQTAPKKVGSALYLMDCLACSKCVPVCPNDANFSYPVTPLQVEGRNFKIVGSQVLPEESFTLQVKKPEQWAVYADFCNECGNCDTYCPEDGGPFAQKPKFFGSMETFQEGVERDGFYVEKVGLTQQIWGRFQSRQYYLEVDPTSNQARFTDHVIELTLDRSRPDRPLSKTIVESGQAGHVLNMKYYFWMEKCLEGVLHPSRVNYVNVRFLESN
jgi:putative selenate reductase